MSDIDFPLTFALMELAYEAYQVTLSDDEFTRGYRRMNGAWAQYYNRDRWAELSGYTLVERPGSTDVYERYWGIVTLQGSRLVVALRGTIGTNDMYIDAMGGLTLTDASGGNISFPFATWTLTVGGQSQTVWVHQGFLNTYLGIQDSVRTAVDDFFSTEGSNITEVYVTGHSLGGGLATLCALDLQLYLDSTYTPKLMTFAAPFVGDQSFATLLGQQVPSNQRFAVTSDYVPRVPTRGWTPPWLAWWRGGANGPEPTRFASYVQTGTLETLGSDARMPSSHALAAYYAAALSLQATNVAPGFSPTDPITSLVLKIKTADVLGAGTDVDVEAGALGEWWGPLDLPWHNDFEQGTLDEYDLFKLFPSKVPAAPTVADLDHVRFHLGAPNRFDFTTAGNWMVSYVDVQVNGRQFIRLNFDTWIEPGFTETRLIHV